MSQRDRPLEPLIQPQAMPQRKPSIPTKTLWTVPVLATLFISDPAVSQLIQGPINWNTVNWPAGARSNSYDVGCPGNENRVGIQFVPSPATGNIPNGLPGLFGTPTPGTPGDIGPDGRTLATAMAANDLNRETRITLTFNPAVILANLRIHDVDANDLEQRDASRNARVWVDEVEITANGGSFIPSIDPDLSTAGIPPFPALPYQMNLAAPNPYPFRNNPNPNPPQNLGPIINNTSAVVINPNFPAGNVATGIGDGTNPTAEGSITADFGTTPINSIEIIYRNSAISPATNDGLAGINPRGEPANQAISLGNINFATPCLGAIKETGTIAEDTQRPGVYTISYNIEVANEGNLPLATLQVADNLAQEFGLALGSDPLQLGQYRIATPPTATGTLSINPNFNGSSDPNLLNAAASSLAVGATETITLTVEVRPDPPPTAAQPFVLSNEITPSATPPPGFPPIPVPPIPQPPTDVILPPGATPPLIPPRIGVAKGVGLPRAVGNGIFEVPYTIRVQNYGSIGLTNVQVEENFAAPVIPPGAPDPAWSSLTYTTSPTPSPGQYTVIGAPNATGTLTGNPTFTGSATGDINLLNPTGNNTLAVGQSELINFIVLINPVSTPVTLNNQVRASGIDPNNPNNPVTDTSVNDANTPNNPNPDPNGDNDPTDNTTPTPVQLPPAPTPRIGVGKSATSATDATPNDPNDGLFDVNYAILVENLGNVDLTNVQLTEDFASQFDLTYTPGAPAVGQYTLIAPPTTTAPLTANGSFTGSGTNTGLLNPAGSTLAVGQQQILTVGVRVNIDPSTPFILDNQVVATGSGGGQTVTDLSNDGTNGPNPNNPDPDPDGDGNPGNNDIPTRVALPLGRPIPRIGTAKAVDTNSIVDLGNGLFNIPYTVVVENAGTDNLNNVQVSENFEEPSPLGFGLTYVPGTPAPGQYTLIGRPTTSSPLRINPSFTGSGVNTGMLNAANSSLPIGERREIKFTVQVNPASIPVSLNNQVEAAGTGATARDANGNPLRVTDLSDDGLSASGGSNLNPNDDQNVTVVMLPPLGAGTGGDFVLVKRITGVTRGGQALPGADFSRFVDDPSDRNDNQLNATALNPIGLPNVEGLQSGDEVEYTIYYLAGGSQSVTNARICDLVPERTTFIANSFGGESGILLRQGAAETAQTNAADGDGGQFFSPLAPVNSVIPPCPTNTTNPNGAVFVNLGNVPNAGPNQTGFLRFRVRLD
jgi:uncharacterized repeat protein (TIGR01451 family)